MRLVIFAAFVGVAGALTASALAAGPADQAVQNRQAALKAMGKTFKDIHGLDPASQRALLVSDAQQLKAEADKPWAFFGPETAQATVKTEALPVIWTDTAGFHAAQAKLINAVAALNAAAPNAPPAEIAQQVADIGAACSACHRAYRAK